MEPDTATPGCAAGRAVGDKQELVTMERFIRHNVAFWVWRCLCLPGRCGHCCHVRHTSCQLAKRGGVT